MTNREFLFRQHNRLVELGIIQGKIYPVHQTSAERQRKHRHKVRDMKIAQKRGSVSW